MTNVKWTPKKCPYAKPNPDILANQPCSPRVGRAFFERLTSNNILPNIFVSNIDGNGAVEYEKL